MGAAQRADPLALPWLVHLAADGTLAEDPPAAGALHFPPSDPSAPGVPLAWRGAAPLAFRLGAPPEVRFSVVADKPLVARDAEGHGLDVTLLADGEVLATGRHAFAAPLLAPGDRAAVALALAPRDVLVPEGAALSLQVRALAPAVPPEGLRILLGRDATLAFPALRAPDVAALRMQDAPLLEFLATEAYPGPGARDVAVGHARVDAPALGGALVLVLRGGEADADAALHAHANRTRRVAAAHEFTVGATVARVHPGLAVAVPVAPGTRVACVRNCPPGGFEAVVPASADAPDPPVVVTDDPGVLIPPPRSTTGVPVSGDAEEKPVPWGPVALAALVVAATARRR